MLRFGVSIVAVGILVCSTKAMPKPQAWPKVNSLQPFTAQTNWMSRHGFARWKYLQSSGRWITREESDWSGPQGADVGPAPSG